MYSIYRNVSLRRKNYPKNKLQFIKIRLQYAISSLFSSMIQFYFGTFHRRSFDTSYTRMHAACHK